MTKISSASMGSFIFYVVVLLAFLAGLILSLAGYYLTAYLEDHWAWFFARMLEHAGEIIGVVAVLSLVSERLAHMTLLAVFSEEMYHRIRQLVFNHLPGVESSGLLSVVDQMNFQKFFDSLQYDDEVYWLDTFAPGSDIWVSSVEGAVHRGAKLYFLVLQSASAFATLRAKEIGDYFNPTQFCSGLKLFSANLETCRNRIGASVTKNGILEIRYYDDLLGCPIYLIRRSGKPVRAFSSLYLNTATGTNFPHLEWVMPKTEVGASNSILSALDQYVRHKWDAHKPLQLTAPADSHQVKSGSHPEGISS